MITPEKLTSLLSDRPVAVRVLAALWGAISAVHILIWLLIALIGGHLDQPWWLFVSLPLGIVVLAAWWLTAPRTADSGSLDDELL